MEYIPIEEQIHIDDYEKFCSFQFDGDNLNTEPPIGTVFCHLGNIDKLFRYTKNDYIVVSPRFDAGIVLQEEAHPNKDLYKLTFAIDFNKLEAETDSYYQAQIGPACARDKCKPSDRYSVKMYAHTLSTFDKVPQNIHRWYVCNLGVQPNRMKFLPFGINTNTFTLTEELYNNKKDKLLYCNFQPNTIERNFYKQQFSNVSWATYRENLPHNEYLDDMSRHKFTLCPAGNGFDSFRIYEALYVGSIPILERSVFSYNLAVRLCCPIFIENYKLLSEDMLYNRYNLIIDNKDCYTNNKLKLSYWKQRFEKDEQSLQKNKR